MRAFFFPPPWKVDIMNTHQWRDSFFTLLATEPPVRTAVDVTPIIDLVRHSPSSRSSLFFFLCSRLSVWLRYLAAAMPAGLRNHLLRWSQHVIDYLHSSCLAPLFVFRSLFCLFFCFFNHYRLFFHTDTHAGTATHPHAASFSRCKHRHTTRSAILLEAWVCVLRCMSCEYKKKDKTQMIRLFSPERQLCPDCMKSSTTRLISGFILFSSICRKWG